MIQGAEAMAFVAVIHPFIRFVNLVQRVPELVRVADVHRVIGAAMGQEQGRLDLVYMKIRRGLRQSGFIVAKRDVEEGFQLLPNYVSTLVIGYFLRS